MKRTAKWWDLFYIGAAEYFSTASKDPSTKVGSVIVRPDKSIAGCGFNGFPQGMSDDEELYADREEKYPRMVHAEINAFIFSNGPVQGSTIYTYPFIPCDRCFVQLAQAGVRRFVAPMPSIDATSRWGAAFDLVRMYAKEMKLEVTEIKYENKILRNL